MELSVVETLLEWIAQHPHYAGLLVFVVALSESLVIVGLIVPGTVLMFGAGALVATGHLPFWPAVIWATVGAIAGDAISYYVGRVYKQQLRTLWPFRNHPQLITRGVDFFERHGGKSVLFGRFVGPVRPVIPAVAGMLGMPATRFFAVNVASALAWAPLYLLPGIAFGTSLELASEVAGRLALFIAVTVVTLWLATWLIRRVYGVLAPRSDRFIYRLLNWSERHPVLGEIPAALVDPTHAEARGLTLLVLVFVCTVSSLAALAQLGGDGAPPSNIDAVVYSTLATLRTPWADTVMLLISGLGDGLALAVLFITVSLWLLRRRDWPALLHWWLAAAVPLAVAIGLRNTVALPRPNALTELSAFGFPSLHATMSTALYGFLAVLVARELRPRAHAWLYGGIGAVVVAIAASRLYLGAHWLVDVGAGIALALAWISLVGIAYRRHSAAPVSARAFVLIGALTLIVSLTHTTTRLPAQRATYTPLATTQSLSFSYWQHQGWQALPALRDDVRGLRNHPLTLQWAAPLAEIESVLRHNGWETRAAPQVKTLLQWLRPQPRPQDLPLLPQVHGGAHDALRMSHTTPSTNRLLVLRLWATPLRLHSSDVQTPLWIGNVTYVEAEPLLGMMVLRTRDTFTDPLQNLLEALPAQEWSSRTRSESYVVNGWDGQLALIWSGSGVTPSR